MIDDPIPMTDQPILDCPYPTFDQLHFFWSNLTDPLSWHGDPYLFQSYVCRFSAYWSFKDQCATVEGYSVLSLGAFGFFGALCTVLTLSQSQFRPLDFLLFRTVGYLEMLQLADVTAMTALAYFRCEFYYTCAFVWAHVATTIANVCSDAVDLIILYLSIERTVACLLPHYFRILHEVNIHHLVEIVCLVFPAIFSMFQAFELTVFYDDIEGRYLEEPSSFSQTEFYGGVVLVNMIRFYFTASMILIATCASVIAFLSVERRRSKLKTSNAGTAAQSRQSSQDSVTSKTNRFFSMISFNRFFADRQDSRDPSASVSQSQQIRITRAAQNRQKRQTELCSLQLCLAAPVVINLILYATGLTTSNYSFITGKAVFDHNITFEKAIEEIDMAQSFQYLRTSTNISNVLAHALHFYLYLLFSDKVRRGFVNFLKNFIPCKARRQGSPRSQAGTTMGMNTDGTTLACERTQLMESVATSGDRGANGRVRSGRKTW